MDLDVYVEFLLLLLLLTVDFVCTNKFRQWLKCHKRKENAMLHL